MLITISETIMLLGLMIQVIHVVATIVILLSQKK